MASDIQKNREISMMMREYFGVEDNAKLDKIVTLCKSYSDQRLREFGERLKEEAWRLEDKRGEVVHVENIDQALSKELGEKE